MISSPIVTRSSLAPPSHVSAAAGPMADVQAEGFMVFGLVAQAILLSSDENRVGKTGSTPTYDLRTDLHIGATDGREENSTLTATRQPT